MLDPFSILAATSFGLRALEFLISTGFKAYNVTREASECEEVLSVYRGRLIRCIKSLEDWKAVWFGFADETYVHFWGKQEFVHIQTLLHDILDLAQSITRQIEGHERDSPAETKSDPEAVAQKVAKESRWRWRRRKGGRDEDDREGKKDNKEISEIVESRPSKEDFQDWQMMVSSIYSGDSKLPEPRHPGLGYRIAFSLFLSVKLQERSARLEELVKQLDEFTRGEFRRMRDIDGQSSIVVTRKEALQAEKFKRATDGFTSFSSSLHQAYRSLGHQSPWSLELRVPDEKGSVSLFDSTSKIDMDLALSLNGNGGPWRRVRVRYKPSHDGANIAASLPRQIVHPDFVMKALPRVPCTIHDSPKRRSVVFRSLLRGGTFDKPSTCKAWEEDRARLIMGLANWTILMWDSPWTAMPCCCGIRFFETDSGSRHYTLAAEEHTDCRNQSLSDHKLLLLGLAMTELLVGAALRIPYQHVLGKKGSANEHRVFLLDRWDTGDDWPEWKPCSREEVLSEVKDKSLTHGLVAVVEYCLDHPMLSTPLKGSPDIVPRLIEEVFKPVKSFYDTVIGQRKEMSRFEHWRSFLQRSDVMWPSGAVFERTV